MRFANLIWESQSIYLE